MPVLIEHSQDTCRECKKETKIIVDHSSGDLICTSCGLVLDERCLDEGQEWRNFMDEGCGGDQNSRVRGDCSNVEDEFGGFHGTSMLGSGGVAQDLQRFQRLTNQTTAGQAPKADQRMKVCAGKLREMANQLALSANIVQRCIDFIKEINKPPARPHPSWFLALVFLACREEKAGRTIRELACASASSIGKREADLEKMIAKKVLELDKLVKLEVAHTLYVPPEELMTRFVNRLQLSHQLCKPAVHIVQESYKYKLAGKRDQGGVIASAIFIVAWLSNVLEKPTFLDVANIAKVSEGCVKACYEEIRPNIASLLPVGFKCHLAGGVDGLPTGKLRNSARH